MIAPALALAASLCWGLSDFLGGVQSRRRPAAAVLVVSQSAALAALTLVMVSAAAAWPGAAAMWPAVVSGVLLGAGLLLLYSALSMGRMSVVAPIFATSAFVPVLWGLASGDRPGAVQVAGMGVALAGVILSARGADGRSGARAQRLAIVVAALAALALGCNLVAIDAAADADPLWAVFVARCALTATVVAYALLRARGEVGAAVRRPGWLPLIGLVDTTATTCFAVASTHGMLSVVTVLATLYPAVTVMLARVVLGERMVPVQRVGVAAAFAGIVLVAGG